MPGNLPNQAPQQPDSPTQDKDQVKEKKRRGYKACLHCRSRKAKCEFGDGSIDAPRIPPCRKCAREGRECILTHETKRGKWKLKRKQEALAIHQQQLHLQDQHHQILDEQQHHLLQDHHQQQQQHKQEQEQEQQSLHQCHQPSSKSPLEQEISNHHLQQSPILNRPKPSSRDTILSNTTTSSSNSTANMDLDTDHKTLLTSSSNNRRRNSTEITGEEKTEEDIVSAKLQNPADALSILSHVAERRSEVEARSSSISPHGRHIIRSPQALHTSQKPRLSNFSLIKNGILSEDILKTLVQKFIRFYHPFIPLIMISDLSDSNLPHFAYEEPSLLSTILTIASRDEQDPSIHMKCWKHTRYLISSAIWGEESSIGAVESLLLLSEWMPRRQEQSIGNKGEGVEDRMSWMMVGNAVRLGYLLGLDQNSFVDPTKDNQNGNLNFHRRILAWTYCYFMDRSISIRIGKAFWSRGPGPTLANRRGDFPTLHPSKQNGIDYAKAMQAYLDLTQIVSNVHDILYPSKERTMAIITRGDYPRYLDDFARSVSNWWVQWGNNNTWHTPISECLQMSFYYLRLYINSFAFSATVTRTIANHEAAARAKNSQMPPRNTINVFPHGIGATADARFIFEAIDAAKSLLTTFTSDLHFSGLIRFIPSRFYLFLIYGQVFLLKAISTGAIVEPEVAHVRSLMHSVVKCLRDASVDTRHIAARYAHLLEVFITKAEKDMLNRATRHRTTTSIINSSSSNMNPLTSRTSHHHVSTPIMRSGNTSFSGGGLPTLLPPLNGGSSSVWSSGTPFPPSPSNSNSPFPIQNSSTQQQQQQQQQQQHQQQHQQQQQQQHQHQQVNGPSPPAWIPSSHQPNSNASGPGATATPSPTNAPAGTPSVDGSLDWHSLTNDYELDWANLMFGWPSMMMESRNAVQAASLGLAPDTSIQEPLDQAVYF